MRTCDDRSKLWRNTCPAGGALGVHPMNDLTAVGLEWLGALALFLGFIAVVRYLDHRERMTLIERGLLRESSGRRSPRGSGLLRGGLITAMVGFAVTIGLYTLGYLLPEPFSAV